MMSFCVTKMAPALVLPSEKTPSGDLPLSTIDHCVQSIYPMVHVYGHGQLEPAKAIREALAKTLVPYYPVAGRVIARVDGKLHVACTREGVVFVEASADFSLKDVGYLESAPLMIPTEQLLPTSPPGTEKMNDLPLAMQVTQFKCGRFSLGIIFHHAVFDGIGIGQFLVALGELCRGLVQPTIKPVWRREAIPNWPKFPAAFLQKMTNLVKLDLELHYIDVSLDCINRTKEQFFAEANRSCTTFEVVTAMVWQCRTRAMDLQLHVEVELGITANTRHLYLRDLKPDDEGYYGNCTHVCMFKAPSAQIANASLVEIVKLIKEGKAGLATQATNFFNGEPFMTNMDYTLLNSIDWRRLGFYETDYGCGKPTNVIQLHQESSSFGSMMLLNPPAPKNGVRLRLSCVFKEHLNAFEEEMKKYMHV